MEKIIKEMVTMKSSSTNMARLSVAAVAVSGLVALGCMVFALRFIGSEMSNIYVLDRGNAMSATMASTHLPRLWTTVLPFSSQMR